MDKVKFFTHYDRPVCDCEYYEPNTSLTVPDQVEPISITVARCLRGEVGALSGSKPTYYEYEGDIDVDKAFDEIDQTNSPGFDLADISSLVASVQSVEATPETVAGSESVEVAESNKSTVSGESQQAQSVDA